MSVEIDSTKARILDAAGTVFAQKGFEAGTIREICQLAGANLAAVNYHFGDKQRLYVAAVTAARCSRVEETPLPEWSPDASPELRLKQFISVTLERMLADSHVAWHNQLMQREIAEPSQACVALVEGYIRPHFMILRGILREMLPSDFSEERLTLVGFSVIGQCLFYRLAQPVVQLLAPDQFSHFDPDPLAEHITNMMLAALGYRAAIGAEEAHP